jgi:hypothetical protein
MKQARNKGSFAALARRIRVEHAPCRSINMYGEHGSLAARHRILSVSGHVWATSLRVHQQ